MILFEIFPTKDSPQQSEVGDAVKRLREAIQEGGNRGPHAQVNSFELSIFQHQDPSYQGLDQESLDFLGSWLQNNKPVMDTQVIICCMP